MLLNGWHAISVFSCQFSVVSFQLKVLVVLDVLDVLAVLDAQGCDGVAAQRTRWRAEVGDDVAEYNNGTETARKQHGNSAGTTQGTVQESGG